MGLTGGHIQFPFPARKQAEGVAKKNGVAEHVVTIDGASFSPADLTASAGDAIVWVNKDPFPHNATSKPGGIGSPDIASGTSWKYTAKQKGDYPYVCTIHPSMKGTIHVK